MEKVRIVQENWDVNERKERRSKDDSFSVEETRTDGS